MAVVKRVPPFFAVNEKKSLGDAEAPYHNTNTT
jgi:hypothetical protein